MKLRRTNPEDDMFPNICSYENPIDDVIAQRAMEAAIGFWAQVPVFWANVAFEMMTDPFGIEYGRKMAEKRRGGG